MNDEPTPQAPVYEEELVVLPITLVMDLLTYLGTKPHTEVNPYITAINRESRRLLKK